MSQGFEELALSLRMRLFFGAMMRAGILQEFHRKQMKAKRTILCVDDNEQSLSIRKVMLETRGYRVITCTGGTQALAEFEKGGVDLVLTDLVMDGMDGITLIDKIKTISPSTPAILFSGRVKLYDRGTRADIFLPKGMYAPIELLEKIRILLVRKRGPRRAILPAGVVMQHTASRIAAN